MAASLNKKKLGGPKWIKVVAFVKNKGFWVPKVLIKKEILVKYRKLVNNSKFMHSTWKSTIFWY